MWPRCTSTAAVSVLSSNLICLSGVAKSPGVSSRFVPNARVRFDLSEEPRKLCSPDTAERGSSVVWRRARRPVPRVLAALQRLEARRPGGKCRLGARRSFVKCPWPLWISSPITGVSPLRCSFEEVEEEGKSVERLGA